MSALSTQIRAHLHNLIVAYGLISQERRIKSLFDLLTAESLAVDSADLTPAWSTINNNGIPFQLVVSSGPSVLRFLTEVGAGGLSPKESVTLSYQRLRRVCDALGIGEHFGSIEKLGDILLPQQDPEVLRTLRAGTIWIGLGFAKNGAARLSTYFDGRWGSHEERWLRLFELLLSTGCNRSAAQLRPLVRLASTFSQPLGVAVDLDEGGLRRIKLYFRTFRSAAENLSQLLRQAGIPRAVSALEQLSQTFLADGGAFPPPALVYYLAITPANDYVEATKIDVCSHCVGLGDRVLRDYWLNLARRLHVDVDDYLTALEELSANSGVSTEQHCHAFLGIGVSRDGGVKLNAYLRPALVDRSIAPATLSLGRPRNTEATVGHAAEYLMANQNIDGAWRDFELPPGRSDAWTTAYVGRSLLNIPAALRPSAWEEPIARAAHWLNTNIGRDAGWGYNGRCATDADSTAHAILFLGRAEDNVYPETTCHLLWTFQQEDGGFSTYLPTADNGTWGISHPDVTPAVVAALLARVPTTDPRLVRALAYMQANQMSDGIWNSFWWSSFLYSTALNLELLVQLQQPFDRVACLHSLQELPLPAFPFDLALLLRSWLALGIRHQAEAVTTALRECQLPDGSWAAHPVLRVTDNTCREPWTVAFAGALYADERRLLTTATVVRSLVAAESPANI